MKRTFYVAGCRVLVAAVAAAACGRPSSDDVERYGVAEALPPIAPRSGSVMVDGCTIDSWQRAQLQSAGAKRVLREVILNCPTMRTSGAVDPSDNETRDTLARQVREIQSLGYRVRFAVTLADQFDRPYSEFAALNALTNTEWRTQSIQNLQFFANTADGLDLFFLKLPNGARDAVTSFSRDLFGALGGSKPFGLCAPPSTSDPSDIPGGIAFDLPALAPYVDRVRLMTLDFSCCGAPPGPTIDSEWTRDVARFARTKLGKSTALDVSFPLYGTDFSERGERSVTFLEGLATSKYYGVKPARTLAGTLHFEWAESSGVHHVTWFDDAESTVRALHAWDAETLSPDVGILFYGLGAEEPRTWETIARSLP